MFQCRVGGSPEISVRWFRHGAEIYQSAKHNLSLVQSVATLEISQVSESDCGNYFCQASNEVGTESFAVELRVKGWFPSSVHMLRRLTASEFLVHLTHDGLL